MSDRNDAVWEKLAEHREKLGGKMREQVKGPAPLFLTSCKLPGFVLLKPEKTEPWAET